MYTINKIIPCRNGSALREVQTVLQDLLRERLLPAENSGKASLKMDI